MAGYQNFSYFDQFPESTVDLTGYLSRFGISLSNTQPVVATLKNLFELYEIVASFKNDVNTFQQYVISEGEKPESVSFTMYGTVDWWWIVLLFNGVTNPFDQWPKTEEQLNYLADRLVVERAKLPRDVYYQILFEDNEKKRTISVPKERYIQDIVTAYRAEMLRYAQ